jgi:dienelactone hydrolase
MIDRIATCGALAALICATVLMGAPAEAQEIKNSLTPEDWAYTLADGVTTKEVKWYSEGIQCWAKIFQPKGFSENSNLPAIVLGHGWTGTHSSMEKYGARFAEHGLVAMVIDYRGWGNSGGFISPAQDIRTDDMVRHTTLTATVRIKRTRLLPMKQVEDYRNAISYIQGEPGVDPDHIGIWGSSYSGGHVVTVAALDARVKVAVGQVPAISGKNTPMTPQPIRKALLEDAIKRARTGKGGEFKTGFSTPRMVDLETQLEASQYHPYHYLYRVPETTALLFIGAENEELYGPEKNKNRGEAAANEHPGPSKYLELRGITHFEMYIDEAFERGSNAAVAWYLAYL